MSNKINIPFVIKTNGSITLYLKSECMTVAQDHPSYYKIIDALKKGEYEKIENLINVSKAVTNYGKGQITVNNGQVFYAGQPVHNTLTERILKMMNEGFKVDHMLLFLSNLMSNSSFRAVNETYKFLENRGLPITEDGCFLAYKAVRNNYFDIHTGRFAKNVVGAVVSMPRNLVNEDWGRDCAEGLHCGSIDYVVEYGHFVKGALTPNEGNRLVIVKVNPANVVCVPDYAHSSKMRVCQYVVVDEIKNVVKELDKASVYKADATPATPDLLDDSVDCPCDECSGKPAQDIDTTSSWNAEKYQEGFEDAQYDINQGNEYGYNRDYSEVNSYRIGYNDAYNGRPNKAKEEAAETASEKDYSSGYDIGYEDSENGLSYQFSLDIDASDEFKVGYSDGYNDGV